MSFGETVSPVAAIQAILHDYPFSASILRELLQNSDDAGATKQIFLLDKDNPALVAYNDSEFLEPDWQAIQSIHQSSKKADTSKIGKYGVGFRACYHITDQPQILSGSFFAVLDPLNSKGMKIGYDDFKTTDFCKYFDFFSNVFEPDSFPGTAIRLPLRSSRSDLSQRIVHVDELQRMIADYISEELNVSLLFLDKLQTTEIWETGNGTRTCLATWTKSGVSSSRHDPLLPLITYDSILSDGGTEYSWRIVQTQSPENEAITRLSQLAGHESVNYIVQRHKLRPDVRIAYPLTSRERMSGRLFTFLPLPSKTGFPVHVHALFALTSSRQSLRNPNETGIVQGSDNDVLIKWNQLLFRHYIPQAWSYLLKTLAEDASCSDILEAWPPHCSFITSGDGVYWQDILSNTFKVVVGSEFKVWPKLSAQGNTTYIDLKSSLIVARGQVGADVLAVLAELGLTLVQLPQSLLDRVDDSMTKLSPNVAHGKLQGALDRFGQLSADQRALVCKYLLSNNDISNIFGFPVIPVLNGSLVALDARNRSPQRFVALTKDEARVFRTSADDAIPLDQLSPETARLIREQATSQANVDLLGPHYVVECLSNGRHVLSDEWLIEFWCWLGEWHLKTELFNLLKESSALQLVPTTKGPQPISFPIFNAAQEAGNVQLFEKLGLAFVTSALPASVIYLLLNHNILKNANDLNHLLTAINLDSVASLTHDEAQSILRLATSYYGSISADNLEKLRKLPIFPLLVPTSTPLLPDSNSSVCWRSIHGINVKGISPIQLIPLAGDMHFLNGPSIEYPSCSLLKQLDISVLKEDDILLHALSHFTSQPKPLQAALVSYIRDNQYRLPIMTQTLRRTAFLRTTDDSLQSPEKVIDPNSPLPSLFTQGCKDSRIPVNEDALDQQLLGDLRTLGLAKADLDANLVQERMSYISSNASSPEAAAIARSLLTLMNEPSFSCFGLSIDPNMCWLPTASGLTTSKKCINSGRRDMDLFDQALVTLDGSISISPSFKALLDWDKPLPLEVLADQLHHTLDSPVLEVQSRKICSIVRELAGRQLRDADIQDVQTAISGRPWVPTKSGPLVQHSRAVFVNADNASGFHEVAFSKTEKEIYLFLCRMGCLEKPTAATIIEELKGLQEQSNADGTVVQRAMLLLDMLPDSMTDEEFQSVLVPDESERLVPLSAGICYYNGLGRERSEADEQGTSVAHHLVTEGLAEKLRMNRLGLEVEDDVDLGGKPITIIRNTLDQYDPKQFFTEFVANASDAKAKHFGLLVDDHEGPTDKLFSTGMKAFQSPSLVVYNDGVFTQDDFKGIRETGIGGKRGKPDVIGYFGLGALSMFHFTELAMIVSGSHVLFLNPAKQSLAYRGRNSVLLSLQRVKRLYPDHLEPLNGLFGFDLNSTGPYQGTIFRLPLRNPSHSTNDPVSLRAWSVEETENMLLKQFDNLAYKSLLFTGLDHIDLLARRGSQSETLRSIGVARVPDDHPTEASFKSEIATFKVMDVLSKWLILSQSVEMPEEFEKLLEKRYNKRHIPPIQVAVAIDGAQELGADRNLFCALPLPAATSLPVHISAPFILEQERRNVRLDNMGTESGFNRWLLSSEIPRLYLYLLEILLETQGTNTTWWPPTRLGRNNGDSMASQVIVDAFWTPDILKASSRQIFASRKKPTTRLAPKDAVALVRRQNFFDTISKILDASNVAEVVELPSELWEDVNYAGLRVVDSSFVKTILEDSQVCQQLNRDDKYMALLFLCCDHISLHNLPLLPLEDESFATILLQGDSDKLYYVLEQAPGVPYPPFSKNRLVHRDLESFLLKHGQTETWQRLLKDYNVSRLSEEGIVELIEDCIKPADAFVGDQDHRIWVDAFWNAQLKLPQAISSFPLVSTHKPLHYISLQKVDDLSVIVLEEPPEQRSCYSVLQSLGLVVVVRQALPSTLRAVLPTKRTGGYAIFLDFVKKHPETLGMLRQLQADEQGVLSSWIRARFSQTPEGFADIACQLPVWPVHQATNDIRLGALNDNDVAILPPSMPRDLLQPFTDHPLVDWDDCMKSAMKEPSTAQRILGLLRVSTNSLLPEPAAYKEFVRNFMTIDKINDQSLLLPNCDFVLQRASDLYEHDEPFIATFRAGSPFLLSQDFQDLAQDLERYGLKRQRRLDLSLFIECAKAFDSEEDNDDKQARAVVLYQSFNSLQLSSLDSRRCSELDLLKFMPRVDSQRPDYDNINTIDYMADIPHGLLAPSQITIPEFEAICWSQKGQTNPPPNATLCGTYQTLGRPDGADVLAHLAVLVAIAQTHGRRRGLLLDLRATYKWLNDHANDIASMISQKKTELLFLNVDDPESDDWTWHPASNLVIDLQDIYDMHNVKGFLRNYNELLKVAGVRRVKKRKAEAISTTDNTLRHMRDRFNNMRQSGFGTDVVFKAQDAQCQILPAHKSWLVACNNHFGTTFIASGMKESQTLGSDIRVEHSSMCVREVIDWFYVGKLSDLLINNSNDEEETKRRLELGLDMLSLADEWEVTDLHEQLQVFIINDQDFLNPYWVRLIQQHAEATMATRLLECCQRYEEENRSIIDDCTSQEPEYDPEPAEETVIDTVAAQSNEEKDPSIIDDCTHQDPEDDSGPAEETVKETETTQTFAHCQNELHLEDTQPIVNNSAVNSPENVVANQGLTPNEHAQPPRRLLRSETPRQSDEQIVTDLVKRLPAFIVNEPCLLDPHWVERIRRHADDTMGLLLFFFFVYLKTLLSTLHR
ncbi:hypothetical protein M378DRAFT_163460 [Amanita muscaria Koide BX008]|uniref:BTB domain-containing protein n=1 Tax=Amanita muscaria (strain Koide BX008) TaxID=946122 RepID=A0A0C2SLZ7_AMAMK|nr:hypothetical protein M378DRAFT_163460 [Amanita muscaria Koide BX008]